MFKRSHHKVSALFVLVIVLLLVGCGDSGGSQVAGTSGGNTTATTSNHLPGSNQDAGGQNSAVGDSNADGVVTVLLKNFAFDPNEIRISAGTTVEFKNEDAIAQGANGECTLR